jgi:hypothetical protein
MDVRCVDGDVEREVRRDGFSPSHFQLQGQVMQGAAKLLGRFSSPSTNDS